MRRADLRATPFNEMLICRQQTFVWQQQTIVWQQQTIVWQQQTIVWREQTMKSRKANACERTVMVFKADLGRANACRLTTFSEQKKAGLHYMLPRFTI